MPNPLQPLPPRLQPLPLWAQVLVGARLVARAVLAAPDGALKAEATEALDQLTQCCRAGDFGASTEARIVHHQRLRDDASLDAPGRHAGPPLREALFWALDAARVARAAQDFPVDGSVTSAVCQAVAALAAGGPGTALQWAILAGAEVDLIGFAAAEAGQGRYDAVPAQVFGRLLPLHPVEPMGPTHPAEPEDDRR